MKQGDVVIVEFPFAGSADVKKRPAVVLSNTTYNLHKNILCAGIYSSHHPLSLTLTQEDLVRKNLKRDSYISLQHIVSLDKARITGVVDALAPVAKRTLLDAVQNILHE
jgi:mRNA interferase MazF